MDAGSLTIATTMLAALLGYALGAIPFGLLLTRAGGTADIRTVGSGNIGATNVLRTGRKGLAAATLVCDILKGTASVLLAVWLWGRDAGLIAGLAAFVGHLVPVWLGFKGGKGVATFLGVLAAVHWPAALVFAAAWLATAAVTRYSSMAALVASSSTPLVLWAMGYGREALLFILMAVLVVLKHQQNIRRLVAGREGKIGGTSAPTTS
jgi:glycerol-3-phosphate acyltransferase PlsY